MEPKKEDTVNSDSEEKCRLVDMSVLSPHIRQQVRTILMEGSLGLSFKEVDVLNPRPSFPNSEGKEDKDCDRFQMVIPYAGTPLECMIIFQSTDRNCPPDFVFSDPRFFVPLAEIKSLVKWNVREPEALLYALKEIIQAYKKLQIEELEKYEFLSYEYLCLFQKEFDETDIEVLVPSDPGSPVYFLIRLHVDMHSYFSDFFNEGYQIEENPLMLVSFPDRNSNKSIQRLYLTKNMETLLGIDESFQLSVANGNNYLSVYIEAIESDLKNKCELSASKYAKRKLYFVKFLAHFAKSVLEYDIMFYTCMVLLLKHGDFHFMVEINLSERFPQDPPAIIFRSIYHACKGAPISLAIDTYPYSMNWPVDKVLTLTVKFMKEYAPLFKIKCTSEKSLEPM